MEKTSFYSEEELNALGLKSFGKNVLISRFCRIYGAEKISIGDMNEYQPEERQKKVLGFIHNTEVLLGMEAGSLMKVMIPLFDRE